MELLNREAEVLPERLEAAEAEVQGLGRRLGCAGAPSEACELGGGAKADVVRPPAAEGATGAGFHAARALR